MLTLVGDAMARPVLDVLASHLDRYDLSSLIVFASGGAVMSASTKAQVAELLPGVITVDGFGSTETGVTGTRARLPGADVEPGTKFTVGEHTAVLDDDLRPVAAGFGRGRSPGAPGPRAARLLQRPAEVGRVDGGGRRCALGVDRRRGDGRRRRHGGAARPRLGEHQHRRREGVPGGGRGGGQGPPRGLRRGRGRDARRALGRAGRRGRGAPSGCDARARRADATLPALARRLQVAARPRLRRARGTRAERQSRLPLGTRVARSRRSPDRDGPSHAQARGRRQPVHLQRERRAAPAHAQDRHRRSHGRGRAGDLRGAARADARGAPVARAVPVATRESAVQLGASRTGSTSATPTSTSTITCGEPRCRRPEDRASSPR